MIKESIPYKRELEIKNTPIMTEVTQNYDHLTFDGSNFDME